MPLAQFDVVDKGSQGDVLQGQGIARPNLHSGTRNQLVSGLESLRGQDVALFSVRIVKQGNVGGAVRVVLDAGHFGRNAVLVPLEIQDPVMTLVPSPPVSASHPAERIPSPRFLERDQKALFRLLAGDLFHGGVGHETSAGRGRFIAFDGHGLFLNTPKD